MSSSLTLVGGTLFLGGGALLVGGLLSGRHRGEGPEPDPDRMLDTGDESGDQDTHKVRRAERLRQSDQRRADKAQAAATRRADKEAVRAEKVRLAEERRAFASAVAGPNEGGVFTVTDEVGPRSGQVKEAAGTPVEPVAHRAPAILASLADDSMAHPASQEAASDDEVPGEALVDPVEDGRYPSDDQVEESGTIKPAEAKKSVITKTKLSKKKTSDTGNAAEVLPVSLDGEVASQDTPVPLVVPTVMEAIIASTAPELIDAGFSETDSSEERPVTTRTRVRRRKRADDLAVREAVDALVAEARVRAASGMSRPVPEPPALGFGYSGPAGIDEWVDKPSPTDATPAKAASLDTALADTALADTEAGVPTDSGEVIVERPQRGAEKAAARAAKAEQVAAAKAARDLAARERTSARAAGRADQAERARADNAAIAASKAEKVEAKAAAREDARAAKAAAGEERKAVRAAKAEQARSDRADAKSAKAGAVAERKAVRAAKAAQAQARKAADQVANAEKRRLAQETARAAKARQVEQAQARKAADQVANAEKRRLAQETARAAKARQAAKAEQIKAAKAEQSARKADLAQRSSTKVTAETGPEGKSKRDRASLRRARQEFAAGPSCLPGSPAEDPAVPDETSAGAGAESTEQVPNEREAGADRKALRAAKAEQARAARETRKQRGQASSSGSPDTTALDTAAPGIAPETDWVLAGSPDTGTAGVGTSAPGEVQAEAGVDPEGALDRRALRAARAEQAKNAKAEQAAALKAAKEAEKAEKAEQSAKARRASDNLKRARREFDAGAGDVIAGSRSSVVETTEAVAGDAVEDSKSLQRAARAARKDERSRLASIKRAQRLGLLEEEEGPAGEDVYEEAPAYDWIREGLPEELPSRS